MKKLLLFSPWIVVGFIIAILLCAGSMGAFEEPKKTTISSATLTEVVQTAKLSTAKFVQNGIAKTKIAGKDDVYILYYAYVKPTVDLTEISCEVVHENKTVKVKLPKAFTFKVELLTDDDHKYYFYPKGTDILNGKEVRSVCEAHAKQEIEKEEKNKELIEQATESLRESVKLLLDPLLHEKGYTVSFEETK